MKLENIEEHLQHLCGFITDESQFVIEKNDQNILSSLGRQTFRGIALTDKQHALLKEKLIPYKTQFENNGIFTLEETLDITKYPIREIDRTKSIEIVQDDGIKIKVKFPFNKRLISLIDKLRCIQGNNYDQASKTHTIPYTDKNFFDICELTKLKNFDMSEESKKLYKDLLYMKENAKDFLPGIYTFKLKNLNDKAIEYAFSTIGEPTKDNLPLYADRKEQLGLHHFDETDLNISLDKLTVLTKKIIQRNNNEVFINSNKYNMNDIASSILELHRFPMLVVLPTQDPLGHMLKVYKSFNGIISNDRFATMFRLDNKSEYEISFNQAVKDYGLNNKLDNQTKIVYISKDKLPKTLLSADWTPDSALLLESHSTTGNLKSYLSNFDLVIHYDTGQSAFAQRNGLEDI